MPPDQPMTRADLCRTVRHRLDCSQTELASMLGISGKAVESYEQGWRHTPDRVLLQLLNLLAIHREQTHTLPPCWEQVQCPPALGAACRSRTLGNGRFCWQIGSPTCRKIRMDEDQGLDACLTCPVVLHLLHPPPADGTGNTS
jgi:DNA-binding XRE family transcriptional regulator